MNRENRSYTHSIDNKQHKQYFRITSEGKFQTVFDIDFGGGVVSFKKKGNLIYRFLTHVDTCLCQLNTDILR